MQANLSPGSAKRKRRNSISVDDLNPSPTRIKTSDVAAKARRDDSPHTSMAGDLRKLKLHDGRTAQDMSRAKSVTSYPSSPSLDSDCHQTSKQWQPSGNIAESLYSTDSSTPKASWKMKSMTQAEGSIFPNATTTNTHQGAVTSLGAVPSPTSTPTLWWSDTELTGHQRDAQDPEDDGEGINGIGFVPTPAIADARAEKRRRQLKEWKERESREARVRRGERRRTKEAETVASQRPEPSRLESEKKVRFTDI